jgi:hypothetical protein
MPAAPASYGSSMVTEAVITCPECGFSKTEPMPTDACRYFYECEACATVLRPKEGDCCVFCSYADHACPPKQSLAS